SHPTTAATSPDPNCSWTAAWRRCDTAWKQHQPCFAILSPAHWRIKLHLADFAISEALDEVVVHHSDCLHMCVYNSRTHEAEPAVFQVLAEGLGFCRGGGNLLHDCPVVHFGLSTDKAPRIRIKTSKLLLNCEKRSSVSYGRLDFLTVSNDPWIQQQL